MVEQKERMKTQRANKVIQALQPELEPHSMVDDDAPFQQSHRYLSNRVHQHDNPYPPRHDLPLDREKPKVHTDTPSDRA
jgi:hypothetical protein